MEKSMQDLNGQTRGIRGHLREWGKEDPSLSILVLNKKDLWRDFVKRFSGLQEIC